MCIRDSLSSSPPLLSCAMSRANVLTQRMMLPSAYVPTMRCGTDVAYGATRRFLHRQYSLVARTVTSCISDSGMRLRACYALSGTATLYSLLSTYARAMRCPVLRRRMVPPASYAMSGTDIAYGPTSAISGRSPAMVSPLCPYAMSGTDIAKGQLRYAPTRCPRRVVSGYAMSGTDFAYAATRGLLALVKGDTRNMYGTALRGTKGGVWGYQAGCSSV
eukprot:3941868-Rhodomonas_salina.2